MREVIRIVGLSVTVAVAYGIAHDLVTTRVSLEYFTIGHPRLIESESPFLLALLWGVLATWWVGLVLGIVLAAAARLGARPKRDARELVRPIAILLSVIACLALLGGLVAYAMAVTDHLGLITSLGRKIPRERHAAFLGAGGAHVTAYATAFLGGVVLSVRTWRGR